MFGVTLSRMAALAAATLVSEDLTCMTAGLLIRDGALSPAAGVVACFAGIVAGDLGLWAAGRLCGRRILSWRWVARRVPARSIQTASAWVDGNLRGAVLASRFLPGTRLPLYLAAGMLGRRPWGFALWSLVAALIWTPLLVLASALLGPAFVQSFQTVTGERWFALAAGIVTLAVVWRLVLMMASARDRARLAALVSRLWRWEFWPAWLFYAPVACWIALLSLRYRGFAVVTAANPAIPDGGFVGESKHQILSGLPPRWVMPAVLILRGEVAQRLELLARIMATSSWTYPVILKPDVGERGAGVKLARAAYEAAAYLAEHAVDVLVQKYHPGPHEAGIFYYRIPGEAHGRIFSITDKQFPEVVGDGVTSLADLIWRHHRYRMQAHTFLARHAGRLDEVPERGERVRLCMAGNHVQGTMFRDGGHLATPELERAIDGIARSFDGFYFGRFDVRYADTDRLKAGQDFSIVELNGVTSESTNIYDPSRSLLSAWATLCRQWSLLFRIGQMNRTRGHKATPMGELIRRVAEHYRRRPSWGVAD